MIAFKGYQHSGASNVDLRTVGGLLIGPDLGVLGEVEMHEWPLLSLFMMRPHANNLNDSFLFHYLMDKPMFDRDPPRIGTGQIAQ